MTDRVSAIIVVLDEDVREDSPYLKSLLSALEMHKGVLQAKTVTSTPAQHVAQVRVHNEVMTKISNFFNDLAKDKTNAER